MQMPNGPPPSEAEMEDDCEDLQAEAGCLPGGFRLGIRGYCWS